MFDRVTAAMIRSAPELTGIDPQRVAADLTDAYVQVSVARSLLDRNGASLDTDALNRLLSIARAQEALALVLEDVIVKQAAASVAARAYQVVALSGATSSATFSATSIPTSVSSVLLFIAADATPDAEEMAQYLIGGDDSIEWTLARAVGSLGRGDFQSVASLDMPLFDLPVSTSPHDIASYVGYYECTRALVDMCAALLTVDRGNWSPGVFANIGNRMLAAFTVSAANGAVVADDTIAGPWHLTTLLNLAEEVLVNSAVTGVAAPRDVDARFWDSLLESLAKRRPTLWRNHRDAIEAGFLEPGVSAVVTFPTGAGKSTVTELKVAATVIREQNVVFLVPTLSLLDQQANALRSTLRGAQIIAQRDVDEPIERESRGMPIVFVMTPESCLASISADPDRFGDVGLIAFDEAHLLSSTGSARSRRAIDASLCLLLLTRRFREADVFLVSAMIGNAEPLRDWLSDMTNRPAVALSDPWKPTRQARGAVVYRSEDLSRLTSLIDAAQSSGTTDGPPVALTRQIAAVPFGFFGLLTTWDSTRAEDYRWLPLLESSVPLSVSGKRTQSGWHLSSNQNKLAAAIASSGSRTNQKVLVFTQQVQWAVSTANDVNAQVEGRTVLIASERALLARAIETAGSASALYGTFVDGHVVGTALPHHGLLLREERRLHESLYKRSDGIPVLVATSTLAQGMNFPSEIVVIAGDRRFDADSNRLLRLEAQELLNAAGRAGRAGMRSNGLVVIVPSFPVAYDGSRQMGNGWFELQQAFSQADQCVTVVDPITEILLDRSDEATDDLAYLARRLAVDADSASTVQLVAKSFGAFQARQSGTDDELARRLSEISLTLDAGAPEWLLRAVASTGIPAPDIAHVSDALESAPASEVLLDWKRWYMEVLSVRPSLLQGALRAGSRAVFKGAPSELSTEWQLEGQQLADRIDPFLTAWMAGATLVELQAIGVELELCKPSEKCEFARKFVLRVVPDLAYLFGLPWHLARVKGIADGMEELPIARLSDAIELGVDTTAKLDYLAESVLRSRAAAHGRNLG